MEPLEQTLLDKLLKLETAAKTPAAAKPKPDFMRLFGEIDALAGRLPQSADPALRHYLRRKSYQKARLLLQGRDAENEAGNCVR